MLERMCGSGKIGAGNETAGTGATNTRPGLDPIRRAGRSRGVIMPRTSRPAQPLRAIETIYGGSRFRSRHEARWAVFFTRLGFEWEYEEQGYKVNGEAPYLPDFFLPELGLYIEIKPFNPFLVDSEGVRRWEDFARAVADNWGHDRSIPLKYPGIRAEVAMACGQIPNPEMVGPRGPAGSPMPYMSGINVIDDWNWAWCACASGQHFDIQLEGQGNLIACGCDKPGRTIHTADDRRILNAYWAARTARFEHGERAA